MQAQNTRRDDEPITTLLDHSILGLPAYTSDQRSLPQPTLISPSPTGIQEDRRFGSLLVAGPTTVNDNNSTTSESLGFPFAREEKESTISCSAKSANEGLLESVAEHNSAAN